MFALSVIQVVRIAQEAQLINVLAAMLQIFYKIMNVWLYAVLGILILEIIVCYVTPRSVAIARIVLIFVLHVQQVCILFNLMVLVLLIVVTTTTFTIIT